MLILIGGGLPDTWTDVINHLPAGVKARPVMGELEKLLDREEIRRVDIVAHGPGALVACDFAATQPHRVSRLVLVDPVLPDERALRLLPGFLLGVRKKELIDATSTTLARLNDIAAEVTVLGSSRQAQRVADLLKVPAQPGGADYRVDPVGFIDEVRGPLGL